MMGRQLRAKRGRKEDRNAMATSSASSLMDILASIPDHRKRKGRRYPLNDLLLMLFVAMLRGAINGRSIEYHLKEFSRTGWLKRNFGISRVPHRSTFCRLMKDMDPKWLADAFSRWMAVVLFKPEGQLILDGKAVRAAGRTANSPTGPRKTRVPVIVSALHANTLLILSQEKVGSKTNEIRALPDIIRKLGGIGTVFSIDAMGCQKEITRLIAQGGGIYALAVKDNQKTLNEEIDDTIDYMREIMRLDTFEEGPVKAHGRIESRKVECCILDDAEDEYKGTLLSDDWGSIRTVAKITRIRIMKSTGQKSVQVVNYISNGQLCAADLASTIRNHWLIENSAHYVLDHRLREDWHNARAPNAVENWSMMRKFIYNMMRLAEILTGEDLISYQSFFSARTHIVKQMLFGPIPIIAA